MHHLPTVLKVLFWSAAAFVAFGSLVPGDELPPIASNDKVLHLLGHGGVALLGALAYPRHWSWLLIGLPLFGATLELLQRWVPNRSFDWLDMVANVSGILLAMIGIWLWQQLVGGERSRAA